MKVVMTYKKKPKKSGGANRKLDITAPWYNFFEGLQPATRRARVWPASSTGVTPKSRLNSRLNCDALS